MAIRVVAWGTTDRGIRDNWRREESGITGKERIAWCNVEPKSPPERETLTRESRDLVDPA